jgi:transcriptional regulator with XRE-family HTH domain
MDKKLQITLRAARINANSGKGFTLIEAAKLLGITKERLIDYERNSGTVPAFLMLKFAEVYGLGIDNIIFVS